MLTRSSPGGRFRNKTWWDLRCERCLTALTKGQRGITFFHPLFSSSCRVFLLFLHTLIFCVATLPHCEALFSFTNSDMATHTTVRRASACIQPDNHSFKLLFSDDCDPVLFHTFVHPTIRIPITTISFPEIHLRVSINHLLAFHHHQWLNSEGILYYLTSSQAFA